MIPQKYHRYILIYLAVVHIAGAIGLVYFPTLFLPLTPVNLFICAAIVLSCAPPSTATLLSFLFVALCGWSVELLGVRTGLIFGSYSYGEGLGLKILDIPITIGLNWGILIYICSQWTKNVLKIEKRVAAAFVVATMMVTLDLLMEYAAPAIDFWTFDGGYAGIQNYIGWWVVSFVLSFIVFPSVVKQQNTVAPLFYLIQIVFFAVLDLLLFIQ